MRSRNPRAADRSANHPIVFGAPYSVYVRAVRLALEEKDVRYELVPIDIFAPGGAPPEYQVRHPFGKTPSHRRGGDRLFVAGLIDREPAVMRAVMSVLGRQKLRVQARKAAHQNTLRMIFTARAEYGG